MVSTAVGPFIMPYRVSEVQNQFVGSFLVVEGTRTQEELPRIPNQLADVIFAQAFIILDKVHWVTSF